MSRDGSIFAELLDVIESRRQQRPADSYITQLLDAGPQRIGEKLVEEAGEAAEAAVRGDDRRAVIRELADLWFHSLVLMGAAGISLSDVEAELARRRGTSGLQEKAARREHAP